METAISFAKTLADPTRLRLIAALRDHELCVCELCDALEISQSTLSTHLTLLRENGFVEIRKEGKWVYYALTSRAKLVTKTVLDHFEDIARDRRVRRDSGRIKKRLKLREDGRCVRGFDQLQTARRARAA
jgi:ArsR family transcriptional regulator